MSALLLPVLAPLMAKPLGLNAILLAGSMAALTYLGAAIFTVVGGPFIYRWGAIRVSQVCLIACAAGLFVGSAGCYGALLLCAFIVGAGNGPLTPASSHLLARTTPASRLSLVFSVKQSGGPLGGLAAGAVGPGIGLAMGWQATLMLLGGACLLCAVGTQRLHKRLDTDARADARIHLASIFEPVRLVFQHPLLLRLALCSMAFAFAQLSVTAYSVTFFHGALGVSVVAAGLLLSIAQTGGIVGRILWGVVADRWLGGRRTLTVMGVIMGGCAACMSLLSTASPWWLMMVLMATFGAAATGWNGVYLAQVARSAPSGQEGTATGGALMLSFTGNILGPMALAMVIQAFGGMREAYGLLAIPIVIATMVIYSDRELDMPRATR